MFWVITQLGVKLTFDTIDQMFDYVNANEGAVEGFAGLAGGSYE